MSWTSSFRALGHRNFRLFFVGQGLSLVGTWMQQVAMSWLVYQLTGSSSMLGLTLLIGQAPTLFLSPAVGALVDQTDRAKVFFLCQILAMVQAFILAALTFTDLVQVWHIMVLSACLGLVLPFDMASRQSLVVDLVGRKKDLPNAIALGAAMFNGSRLIGPALAGIILSLTSAAFCFAVNGISFLAILIALRKMHLPVRDKSTASCGLKAGIGEGFRYVGRSAPLRNLLLLIAITSLTSSAHAVLLPAYTTEVMNGGPKVFGLLGGAVGVGSFLAALFLATRRTIAGLGKWAGGGLGILGVGLLAAGHVAGLGAALVCFFLIGFGMVIQFASGNTIIQSLVHEDKRGRVMGLYTMAIVGMTPLGSYASGWLGEQIGLVEALEINGVLALTASAVFLVWLPRLHGHIKLVEEQQTSIS